MTPLQRHQDEVREIANKVALLIINENIRELFTDNITRLCRMVEEYGEALQPYVKKLEKTEKLIDRDKKPERFVDEYLTDICPPPKGYVKIDSRNNQFVNVPRYVIYGPAEPVNPLLWFGLFGNSDMQREPMEEDKLMCDYFLLAAIHDQELQDPTDRPIFSQKYEGKWFQRDKFRYALWQYNRSPARVFTNDYDYDPSQQQLGDYEYGRKVKRAIASSEQFLTQFRQNSNDKRAKLNRALQQVQADCTKNKLHEKDRKAENWHNEDFTEVIWNGKKYKFDKPQQSLSIRYLWENKRAREKSIGEAIGSEADNFRLIHIFRQKGKRKRMHPAWGEIIVPDGRGIYALAEGKKTTKE